MAEFFLNCFIISVSCRHWDTLHIIHISEGFNASQMGQSFILKLSTVWKPSFVVSRDPHNLWNRYEIMLRKAFFLVCTLEWKKWFLCGSVPTGKAQTGQESETEIRHNDREEGGIRECLSSPSSKVLRESCCSNRNVCHFCLSSSEVGGLHTWGTPSLTSSHASRNSAVISSLHHTQNAVLHCTSSCLRSHTGKHECNGHLNA